MCDTCGCQQNQPVTFIIPGQSDVRGSSEASHSHTHTQHHEHHTHHHHHDAHDHEHYEHTHVIQVQQDVLSKNNLLAYRNRGYFEAKRVKAFNLVSSPGSGKTTILQRTIEALKDHLSIYVIEGDQQTTLDADRIHATGVPVIQINTGSACHLDAEMIYNAIQKLQIAENALLFVENVGNLVCPAMFDLGETYRVVISSVTEGMDKPMKYPYMFQSAHICIINKIDLLPYVDFDIETFKQYALRINHHLKFFELSARTMQGFDAWIQWVKAI